MFKFITTLVLTLASAAAFAAVDINKADQATLETVKGVGPGLSGKLLDERKKGSFKDWGDLIERVGGVGPGNAARLSAAGLTVGDKAYAAAAPGADGFTAKVPAKASDKAKVSGAERKARRTAKGEAKTDAAGHPRANSAQAKLQAKPQATHPAAAKAAPAMR